MASSTFTIAYLVDFESVLNIPDNEGMQNMFKALESSGLHVFLGCKSVLYEPELEHFFDTALIQGGDITGVISGKYFSISPSRFAGVFELPTEGLSDFFDVSRNLVSDARKIFSKSGVPVVPHGKKKLLKYEYRLLNDILAKSITVKAGSFDAVTTERFQMILNSVPALTMGEETPYLSSKILSPKTVLRYITTNQTADTRGQSDEGGRTPLAIVKRASKSKKKSESTSDAPVEIVLEVVGSKKRSATEGSAPVVPKKRRTVKNKHSPSQANLDIVNIAQDVVPLQIVDPTPAAAAIKSPAPKRISKKKRLILPTGSDDESIATQKPVKDTHEVAVKPTDEVDMIIEQVLEETLDLGVSEETQGGQRVDEVAFTDDFGQWLDDFVSRNNEPEIVGTRTFTKAEGSTIPVVEKNLVQAVGSKQVGEEHMSIDDLLMQISEDMMLPSVTTAEITKISLPRISIHDKGKAVLVEYEPVRGNPARETVELICGDVDFLVQLRDQVMKDVVELFHSFSLNKLPDLDSLKILKEKEKFMLEWAETDSMEMAPWTATTSQIIDLLSAAHSKSLKVLVTQQKENGLPIEQPCTSTYLDTSIGSGAVLAQFFSQAKSKCWVRPMVLIDGTSLPVGRTEFVEALDDLRAFILQRVDDSNSAILSKIHTLERGLRDTLHDQDANARKLINSVCQDAHTISDVQKIHLNDVKKVVLAQGVTAGADSLEIRKEFKALDAKINSLDGQVAAIRNEQLEFQTKIAADILSLSTQLGDLVEYIRGGDAKKGEGSSSRRPLPTPVHQSEGTGDAVRLTEPTQADIDAAQRDIFEIMARADRERDRERRERRLSRSGAYKRRRGH
ncbi:nuclear matrix constituent protein 1-like protein-like [Dorcoceras hygrometricum]|uniref:Nuclear matrix constituent protein 1-like protein-like n=1 Tax=Dorcoceras hygrometricum TaxID=472368 RepID=A0A2Z7ALT4_9LAMI|nr:nuclear matrix constituent protein 1-like protein-like [Dorcoceras hygrometricum]